jgi:hypothetical protein
MNAKEDMLKGAYWIIQRFLVHYQIHHLSNIAIAILEFSQLLPFSYRSSNFAIAKLSLLKAIAKSKGKISAPSRS